MESQTLTTNPTPLVKFVLTTCMCGMSSIFSQLMHYLIMCGLLILMLYLNFTRGKWTRTLTLLRDGVDSSSMNKACQGVVQAGTTFLLWECPLYSSRPSNWDYRAFFRSRYWGTQVLLLYGDTNPTTMVRWGRTFSARIGRGHTVSGEPGTRVPGPGRVGRDTFNRWGVGRGHTFGKKAKKGHFLAKYVPVWDIFQGPYPETPSQRGFESQTLDHELSHLEACHFWG